MAGLADRRVCAALIAALALACGLIAAGWGDRASAQGGGLQLKRIGGFDAPVYAENAPGARGLLFVVEQPGTVRVVRKGRTLRQPFLDIRDHVRYGGEQGLLSIAFDPRYERNRRFYLYYVNSAGDIRVDLMRRKKGKATRAEPRSRRKVIEIPHPQFENHNGGQLQFAPDRSLLIGTGDGGSAGDPQDNAQNPNSLLGKLLRIEPRRKGGYSTPSSNPFAGGGGRDEIYSLGLRNPYRFSFDSRTNDLFIGDVGQNQWEEIDHVGFEGARGANFGWDLFEGNHTFEGDGNPPANYKPPIHEYSLSGANCAVTGGYVVRDPGLPSLAGRYVYADFCGGEIRSLDPYAANPSSTDASTGLRLDSPSSFGEGARNRIYVTSLGGGLFRIAG
ncbi:MAG TPA: PQQ-dependent sugar dehydrogenase [Solirubrobacterales bacterium]|nr:PQQ-dependent sugar dehydrogenase [Solirubrobacterales bacterium]